MTEDTMGQFAENKPLDPENPQGSQDGEAEGKKRVKEFRQRIDACKQYRRKLIANWVSNIDYRRGKPFASQTDEDRVVVNIDWALTKAKHAALFSQIPQVRVDHFPQTTEAGPWFHQFQQRLNDTLIVAGIETAMDEVMPDVINAAGIGAILVSHEAITEPREVPAIDMASLPPEVAKMAQEQRVFPDGSPVPMQVVPWVLDRRYVVQRISPSDLLWPINFTGADFDNAPWIGRSGRVSWSVAKQLFGLQDEDKKKILSGDGKTHQDKLTHDADKDKIGADDEVVFDEIFYKDYNFDANAKSFLSIHRMVFIAGKEDPVVDEPWEGQKVDPNGGVIGALRYPIRVLTLTYISDETIPPSDSAIGRPQVNELNKSRTQMILQRERSLPIRWFDVNRIDPTIQQSMMRGTWQGMIPVQGAGDKSIGEVARAVHPQENFNFDRIAKDDLNETWQLGPNQLGNFGSGRQSAAETNTVEANFQTRIGRERAKVSKFFVSIAEVLGGLICLFEDPASFGEGFDPSVSKVLSYSILADSTVLLDANQRLDRLMKFINNTAKSGWVDVGPVIKEIATLSGLDPNVVVRPPEPAPPETPNISLRLTGIEDMMNPLTLATLMKSGQAPDPQLIEQAKKLIQLAVTPPADQMQQQPGAMPPAPPDAMGVVPPMPPPPGVGEANPNMTLMPKIDKRSDDGRPS